MVMVMMMMVLGRFGFCRLMTGGSDLGAALKGFGLFSPAAAGEIAADAPVASGAAKGAAGFIVGLAHPVGFEVSIMSSSSYKDILVFQPK